jgi:hypothetical protein
MHILLSNLRQEAFEAIFDLVKWGYDELSLHERKLYWRIVAKSHFGSQWFWNAKRQAVSPLSYLGFHINPPDVSTKNIHHLGRFVKNRSFTTLTPPSG